jgi:peptidoglycan/LPS O-acetylase OafA/YrhL
MELSPIRASQIVWAAARGTERAKRRSRIRCGGCGAVSKEAIDARGTFSEVETARLVVVEIPSMAPRDHGRLPALDVVRGLAILAVTLYRFRGGPGEEFFGSQVLYHGLGFGARGVDLFFVLSGLLITGILYDSKPRVHYFRDFYARRVLRIFPLYYGVLLAAFCVLPLFGRLPAEFGEAEANQSWLWLYGANLLVAWKGEWCLGSFDHFWSLGVEEHFYLLWPLVIYAFRRKTAMTISAIVAAASAIARIGWVAVGGDRVAAEAFTLFRLDGLLAGAWCALAARGPGGLHALVRPARRVACSILLLLPAVGLQSRLMTAQWTLCAVFFGALAVLAMAAMPATIAGRFWQSPTLRFLGKYSYGMYVFQNPLIPLLSGLFTAESLTLAFGSALGGRLAYIVLMSAATVLAAMVSWHLYEKHFLKLKVYFEHEPVASTPEASSRPIVAVRELQRDRSIRARSVSE